MNRYIAILETAIVALSRDRVVTSRDNGDDLEGVTKNLLQGIKVEQSIERLKALCSVSSSQQCSSQ